MIRRQMYIYTIKYIFFFRLRLNFFLFRLHCKFINNVLKLDNKFTICFFFHQGNSGPTEKVLVFGS